MHRAFLALTLLIPACGGLPRGEARGPAPAIQAPTPTPEARPSAEEDLVPAPAAQADAAPAAPAAQAPLDLPRDPVVRQASQDFDSVDSALVLRRLEAAITQIDRDATLEDRMLAHALLGRLRDRAGNTKQASAEFQKVTALWSDPQAATREIGGDAPDELPAMRRLGRALTALGEALFFEAEQKAKLAAALIPPRYRGAGTKDASLRHVTGDVKKYVLTRRARVQEAETAYRRILEIKPLPPPHWVVLSAERVGALHEATARSLLSLPKPSALGSRELELRYRAALFDLVAPDMRRATDAYRTCVDYAVKFRAGPALESQCKQRLSAAATAMTP